jgi:5'(3')-deoxyribonucleotidase
MIRSLIVDVDNVLADSIGSWCRLARLESNLDIEFGSITSHKLIGCVRMSPREVFRLQDQVWRKWRSLKSTERGIGKTVSNLRKVGVKIIVATSGPSRHLPFVKRWLTFRRLKYDTLCNTSDKSTLEGDAIIDDAPEEARGFAATGRPAFLYDRPWNRTFDSPGITRIQRLQQMEANLSITLRESIVVSSK